jgi:hypothetical protein
MFQDARVTDLFIPLGQYYLADAGFPSCSALLIPFRGTHYHLQEWGCANHRYMVIVSNYLLMLICLSLGHEMQTSFTTSITRQLATSLSKSLVF